MDIVIEQKKGIKKYFQKKYIWYWIGGVVALLLIYLLITTDSNSVSVKSENFNIAEVKESEFNDYIRQSGQVLPMNTVQISPLEGGIVEEIVNEEGSTLKAGDVIVRLSNQQLDMEILHSEADLAEKENHLRNTMIDMEKQKLDLEQNRLTYTRNLNRARRDYEQKKKLYAENLCSKEEFIQSEEDFTLAKQQLELNQNRAKQDSLYRSVQIKNLQESLASMRKNMEMITRRKENLNIKAPIDGELGLLDAVKGQYIRVGDKIAQINNLESYKIEVLIDEHYIDRVTSGLDATFEKSNETYSAQIRKVYPEVRNGKFRVDLKFTGEEPDNIRTGQTYYLNIQLGSPTNGIIIPKGTFYQHTGGQWIYVVDESGNYAVKRSIRIGRQNPKYYEILEGLEPGEKVIISGYENFGDSEKVEFK